jgi:hypothetical protein
MVFTYHSIFSEEELQYILNLPEVLISKEEIDKKQSGSVYFNSALNEYIKNRLTQTFNNDFSNLQSIPMRWIKGDTVRHQDKGEKSFQNSYLVYINDSVGELILNDESYPMVGGTGYLFSEGIRHETRNTSLEPRLLIGPMSETGVSVGIPATTTLQGDGGVDTFYLRQGEDIVEYQKNSEGWNPITTFPITVNNTNPASILKVIFTTNIIVDNVAWYFICSTDGIQIGSSSLNNNERVNIDISGVTDYYGLIENGTEEFDGYNNIYIYNLIVSSTGSTLGAFDPGGWVGRSFFGASATDNYIINCSSTGPIPNGSGGIVGTYCCHPKNAAASMYIYGCSSSGTIDDQAGGIVGGSACSTDSEFTTEMYIEQCYSTGAIGPYGGGIVGSSALNYITSTSYISIYKCYSTGDIAAAAGGIVGAYVGSDTTSEIQLEIDSCYATGSIASDSGGICGDSVRNTNVINCYTTGYFDSDSGGAGIFGYSTNSTAINCYVSGSTNVANGYIFGNSATVPPSCYSEAQNSVDGITGGWNSINANTALTGVPTSGKVGSRWVATILNSPYELNGLGYTPYTINNITSTPQLNQTFIQTISAGESSVQAINADASGNNFSLLAIENGNPSSYDSITISSQTGIISTSSGTAPATYTLIIRSVGSYNITIFNLTIAYGAIQAEEIASCCDKTLDLKGLDYTTRNVLLAGNVIIGSSAIQRSPISYSELLMRKIAYASKRYEKDCLCF